jgi:dUTP pyrophosphatase
MEKILVKKLKQEAIIPNYQSAGASGFDLHAIESIVINPGEIKLIGTGLAFELPEGFELQIRSRSGLAVKNGITNVIGIGTVDNDYRGEIKVGLINHSKEPYFINIGDRIAQGVLQRYYVSEFEEVSELSETTRGEGGFNSTGK